MATFATFGFYRNLKLVRHFFGKLNAGCRNKWAFWVWVFLIRVNAHDCVLKVKALKYMDGYRVGISRVVVAGSVRR
ncbi:Uncharacterized protein TCM_011249 [Theobroma cacao]|uniref:Uncharacterized protein n=1 Tax=Theobroma cacao TaxID=3641 RepID=A0A061E8N1_THECC|nr:Uncharacterized protein TCM_011249 [Theobroma cacao]